MPLSNLALFVLILMFFNTEAIAAPAEFWYSHTGAAASAITELCQRFNVGRFTEDQLQCLYQGSYEQTLQKTVAAYRAGKSPTLVEIYDVATPDMLLGGASYPVQKLMAEHNRTYPAGTFLPVLKRYYSGNDHVLAAQPFAVSTAVLYSHREALAAVGIFEPPKTWEAFSNALYALKRHGSTCPAVTALHPWIWLEQTSAAQGAPIASHSDGADLYRFDNGTHPKLMNQLALWRAQGLIQHQDSTRSGQQALAFASGDCALLLDSTGAWNVMRNAQENDVEVSALPIYAGTERKANAPGGSALWIMRGREAQEYAAATAFLDFLLQPENQLLFSSRTGYLPVTRASAAQAIQNTDTPTAISVGLAALARVDGQKTAPVRCGFVPLMRLIWSQQIENALAGQQSIDQALQQAVVRSNTLLSLFGEMYADQTSDAACLTGAVTR
jgi:sn-glycerol 3-phosphate transport system substrate-binding protein